MTIYERLDDETRKALGAKKPVVYRPKSKHTEQLSKRDIEELMGVRRDTYKKVNGKVKRK